MDETVESAGLNPNQPVPQTEPTEAAPAPVADEQTAGQTPAAAPEGQAPVSLGDEPKPEGDQSTAAPDSYQIDDDINENAPALAEALGGAAKELKMSQEQLNTFVEKMRPAFVQHQRSILERSAKLWEDRTLADPEIGGQNLKANMQVASKAYKSFASDALRKEFSEAKLDRHPEVIRLFLRIGRALGEDTAVQSVAAKGFDYSDPRTMYPHRKLNR